MRRAAVPVLAGLCLVACNRESRAPIPAAAPTGEPNPVPACTIDTSHDNVSITDGVVPNLFTIQVKHPVKAGETLDQVADCYFTNADLGRLSIQASNPHDVKSEQLHANTTLFINVTDPTGVNVPNGNIIQDFGQSGWSENTTNVLLTKAEPDLLHQGWQYVPLPKEAACQPDLIYYVAQADDTGNMSRIMDKLGRPSELWGINIAIKEGHVQAGQILHTPLVDVVRAATEDHPPLGLYECSS